MDAEKSLDLPPATWGSGTARGGIQSKGQRTRNVNVWGQEKMDISAETEQILLSSTFLFYSGPQWVSDANPRWYHQHPTTKRHTLQWPPHLRAWALVHSWCLIHVCQNGIRENLLTDRHSSLTDRNTYGPAAPLCFSEKTVRAEREGDWPITLPWTIIWTHDVQRESGQSPWCGACLPACR